MELIRIATIKTDFPTKFGIPRQSGLAEKLLSTVIFEKSFRVDEALRGLEGFSHIWLIWGFSQVTLGEGWSPTVRPPRLGGNIRRGVFATRSPYRPNRIGLSSVRLEGIEKTEQNGTVLQVSGADLMDGTPIYDIKPYLPFTDCHSDAVDGFAGMVKDYSLQVDFCPKALAAIPTDKVEGLREVLSQDPRPAYQDDYNRVYGFYFADWEVKFCVKEKVLTVLEVIQR